MTFAISADTDRRGHLEAHMIGGIFVGPVRAPTITVNGAAYSIGKSPEGCFVALKRDRATGLQTEIPQSEIPAAALEHARKFFGLQKAA